MRKNSLILLIFIGLLIIGCSNKKSSTTNENVMPQIVQGALREVTLEQATEEADIIANITITDIADVVEVSFDEWTTHEYTIYEAIVNHYIYDALGYGEQIKFLQAGGPNWQFDDDPLLEVGEIYIVFLDEREDTHIGRNLAMTGGPQGRYNKVGDVFVRQVNPMGDNGLKELTERELIQTLNERNEELNIDLSIIE